MKRRRLGEDRKDGVALGSSQDDATNPAKGNRHVEVDEEPQREARRLEVGERLGDVK